MYAIRSYYEFESSYKNYQPEEPPTDLLEFIRDHSPFLKKEGNNWMKAILTIVRNTAQYFAPQIRSKIMNEGWASYWHDKLFRSDERIAGHEIGYGVLNAA